MKCSRSATEGRGDVIDPRTASSYRPKQYAVNRPCSRSATLRPCVPTSADSTCFAAGASLHLPTRHALRRGSPYICRLDMLCGGGVLTSADSTCFAAGASLHPPTRHALRRGSPYIRRRGVLWGAVWRLWSWSCQEFTRLCQML